MLSPARYLLVILLSLIGVHFLLTITHEQYGNAVNFSHLKDKLSCSTSQGTTHSDSFIESEFRNTTERKANAAFVILARNSELNGVLESIKMMEDRFNRKFGYPYVFLNEQPFTSDFIKYTSDIISTKAEYGVIPPEQWYQPEWIDEERAAKGRWTLQQKNIIYGESVPYRNMCRFNSGFFFRHPLMLKYDYYWRIEPGVKYFCDLDYDPFLFMKDNNKVYGFTISLYEFSETIETLWQTVKDFIHKYPDLISEDNAMRFLSDDGGETYNLCHFWSNFEIGDLNFWRSPAYMTFFEHLEKAGGFYYERWGDAPVHSIGAALLARKDQLHFFNDIGYKHDPFMHCPTGLPHTKGKCWCDQKENFDYDGYSCHVKYETAMMPSNSARDPSV
ncbi:alpha 1,2-mannosyltransferase 2.4.1 [Tulasnella sp. UAMH 9824]|nr:alpha 1,2-mannosyltransferase 2.4.1 [Tulasnella sp. UAMH 9824]